MRKQPWKERERKNDKAWDIVCIYLTSTMSTLRITTKEMRKQLLYLIYSLDRVSYHDESVTSILTTPLGPSQAGFEWKTNLVLFCCSLGVYISGWPRFLTKLEKDDLDDLIDFENFVLFLKKSPLFQDCELEPSHARGFVKYVLEVFGWTEPIDKSHLNVPSLHGKKRPSCEDITSSKKGRTS